MTFCNHSNLATTSDTWKAAQQQERKTYAALISEIIAAELAGVSEVDMVKVTGLARMTVRKYRRKAFEPSGGSLMPEAGS